MIVVSKDTLSHGDMVITKGKGSYYIQYALVLYSDGAFYLKYIGKIGCHVYPIELDSPESHAPGFISLNDFTGDISLILSYNDVHEVTKDIRRELDVPF